MASIKIKGDTSGDITLSSPAVSGTNTLTLPTATETIATENQTITSKNFLDNGNFDIWQAGRVASSTTGTNILPDRWQYITDGTLSTATTFTQQSFTVGQTDVPNNPKYYLDVAYTSVNTPSNYIRQRIEDVRTLQGETITISGWLKCASGTITCGFQYQQEFGTGGSPSGGVYPAQQTFTVTTSWQKFSKTFTVNSISGKTIGTDDNSAINIAIILPASGTNTVSFSQIQCERGSVATSYDVKSLAYELARCQRYYYGGALHGAGCSGGGTSQYIAVSYPQTMRAIPTISWVSGGRVGNGTSDTAITGLTSVIGSSTYSATLRYLTASYGTGGNGLVSYQEPIMRLGAEL